MLLLQLRTGRYDDTESVAENLPPGVDQTQRVKRNPVWRRARLSVSRRALSSWARFLAAAVLARVARRVHDFAANRHEWG